MPFSRSVISSFLRSSLSPGILGQLLLFGLFMVSCKSGCVCSGADVKEHPVQNGGDATIVVNGLETLASPTGTKVVAVRFGGQVVASGDGSGDGSFNVSRNFEVTSTSVTPTSSLQRTNLHPGRWRITVQAAEWTASAEGSIAGNRGTTFTFRVGQQGATVN